MSQARNPCGTQSMLEKVREQMVMIERESSIAAYDRWQSCCFTDKISQHNSFEAGLEKNLNRYFMQGIRRENRWRAKGRWKISLQAEDEDI